jgi:hypothetical protein
MIFFTFSIFVAHICPHGSGSGSTDLIESGSNRGGAGSTDLIESGSTETLQYRPSRAFSDS